MRVRATAGSSDRGTLPRLRSTCKKLPNPIFEYLPWPSPQDQRFARACSLQKQPVHTVQPRTRKLAVHARAGQQQSQPQLPDEQLPRLVCHQVVPPDAKQSLRQHAAAEIIAKQQRRSQRYRLLLVCE